MTIKKGYKQTDIGVIPEDWEVKSVGEIFKILSNATFSRAQMGENGYIQCLHYGDIHTKYNEHIDFSKTILPKVLGSISTNYPLLQNGDIVMADASEDYVGLCKYVEVKNIRANKVIAGLHTILLREKGNIYQNGFKGFVFLIPEVRKQLIELSTGMKVFGVSKKHLTSVLLSVPTLAEQTAIASALSDIDSLIEALDKKIAKKRAIKEGTMQQLLTGKKRLAGFTEPWVEKKLGKIGKTYGGLTGKTKNDFGIGDCKYITFLNILNNPIVNVNYLEKVNVKNGEHQNQVQTGDLFFNTSSETPEDVGICSVLLHIVENLYLNSFCFGYRIQDNEVSGLFLSYFFRGKQGRELMTSLAQGATRYNLSKSLFNSTIILLPPTKSEQTAIAQILSDMDNEIEQLKKERQKYIALKQGAMQTLLTGQIRLVSAEVQPQKTAEIRTISADAHVIGGHIVNELYRSKGWGKTKLQKSIHLIDYYCQLDFGGEYIRNVAGPDNQSLMNYIDSKFKQYNHVRIDVKNDGRGRKHYNYTPTPLITEIEQAFERFPAETQKTINDLLNKIKKMDLARAEIVSTLYAVWNNRIIKKQPNNDDLLLKDFYDWSEHKSDFSRDLVLRGLNYMRQESIIPLGWGKYIDKK